MNIEEIREKFRQYHNVDGYREEHHVKMDNEAFPHTFNASGLENQIKEIIDQNNDLTKIEDKFYCIQPCFRRFDIENVYKSWYSIFFQMCGKCHITQNLIEELPIYFKKHIIFFTKEIWLEPSKLWYTIFWWWKISKIWDTKMPKDERSEKLLIDLWISPEKIVSLENPAEKWEIDNFLVRFERDWEHYAGYWIDIYYDLGNDYQLWEDDIRPGNVKWWRFVEISTTWILDYRRVSWYWEEVNLTTSPMPTVVSWLSLERLAFITQTVDSIFKIDCYNELRKIIVPYWYSHDINIKLLALLVPFYYIISEWNLPWWSNTWKNRDLRLLIRDVFDLLDTYDWLRKYMKEDSKIEPNRRKFFEDVWTKEISLFLRLYDSIYNNYSRIYDTLFNKNNEIVWIIKREHIIYLESKYKKLLEDWFFNV